jgi:hypothetical protein
MRFHSGLKVYTNLFALSTRRFLDFLIWYMLIIGALSMTLTVCYNVAGTNRDFSYVSSSFLTILKLTFGFYDLKSFSNNGAGLGESIGRDISQFMFWLCLVLSGIVGQNIMLAIVVDSYDEACKERDRTQQQKEDNILTLLYNRIIYFFKRRLFRKKNIKSLKDEKDIFKAVSINT